MKSFFFWAAQQGIAGHPWLIFGKGPSFSKRSGMIAGYKTLGLNHVVRDQVVDVVHIIDLDVVDELGEVLVQQVGVVVMPWVPHVKMRPGKKTLAQLVSTHRVLHDLEQQQRLFFYHLSTSRLRHDDSPNVKVRFFSVEAAIRLLALSGVKKIRTLGVDGGRNYNGAFTDLQDKTLLANGRSSFDKQFLEFGKIIMQHKIDLAPADMPSPVRVYVATQEEQMLSVKVLEYSIRKHSSLTVEVYPMHQAEIEVPMPREQKNRPRTPFSFQRFLIPQLAGFQGRAIYLDSDMQLFQDIKGLWGLPFGGAQLLAVATNNRDRKPQFSVMLLDCAALSWRIKDIVARLDSDELNYACLMYDMAVAETIDAGIDPVWNALEHYEAGKTALLHYTDMTTQPWVTTENPLAYLWVRDLLEAIEHGFISLDYVKEQVELGYVRPSLLYQIEHNLEDPLLLPKAAKRLDKAFQAPYKSIHAHGATPWQNYQAVFKAFVRHGLRKTGIAALWRKVQNRLDR